MAGLTTLYEVQEEWAAHLHPLRQAARRVGVNTRAMNAVPAALVILRSSTTHHQRQFVHEVQRWNNFLASNKCPADLSVAVCGVQKFKVSAHEWLTDL